MKVRTEDEIQSVISKGLKGLSVYKFFFSISLETKLFKLFIIFRIFISIKVKDTGIPIPIWCEYNMG